MYKGAVAPKTALPYGRDSCIAWNRCHIFTNKRGTYGIIADDLRFATQLSNVYGNAIRAKLATAQTTRSVAKAVFCFPSLWQSKRKKPNFFTKNDSGKTLAEVTEKTLQDQRERRENLERITREYGTQLRMNRSIQTEGLDKCVFSAVQVLYQIYKLNLPVFMSGNFFLYRVLCCEKLYSYS